MNSSDLKKCVIRYYTSIISGLIYVKRIVAVTLHVSWYEIKTHVVWHECKCMQNKIFQTKFQWNSVKRLNRTQINSASQFNLVNSFLRATKAETHTSSLGDWNDTHFLASLRMRHIPRRWRDETVKTVNAFTWRLTAPDLILWIHFV